METTYKRLGYCDNWGRSERRVQPGQTSLFYLKDPFLVERQCFFPFFSLAIAASQILRKNCWRTRSMPSMLYWMRRSSTANSSSWAPPRRTWAVVFWGTGGVVRGKNLWPILALNPLDYFCSRNRINCVKIWWFSNHVRSRRRVNPEWREVSWSRSIGYNYCVYVCIYIYTYIYIYIYTYIYMLYVLYKAR